ncbi:MAG: signal recognition particle-docking protein FtsY [Nanobdellota archaeon]
MFNFFKEKLKKTVSAFSKKVEEEGKEETQESLAEPSEPATPETEESPTAKTTETDQPLTETQPADDIQTEDTTQTITKPETQTETTREGPQSETEEVTDDTQPQLVEETQPERSKETQATETQTGTTQEEPLTTEIHPEIPKTETSELPATEKTQAPKTPEPPAKQASQIPEAPKPLEEQKTSPEAKEAEQPKQGFFSKIRQSIVTKKITEAQFEDLFWELEITMLENNVAVEVIEKIKDDLKRELVDNPIPRNRIEATILATLKRSIEEILDQNTFDIFTEMKKKKPYVICFIGVNGSGKTTTIAKFAHMLQENNKSVVLAAADTFRAAAIDQLAQHAKNLNTKIIKHDYGHDSAAVAYDAVKHAEAKDRDVVLIDTAGRLHSNKNLLDELKKVIKVSKPDIKLFVGESITGNDCVEQAKEFNEAVGIDGIILSKADIDEKGGAAISVSYVTGKPILFMGNGQEYDDLEVFRKEKLLESLNL